MSVTVADSSRTAHAYLMPYHRERAQTRSSEQKDRNIRSIHCSKIQLCESKTPAAPSENLMPNMAPRLLQLINKITSKYSHCFQRNLKKTPTAPRNQTSLPLRIHSHLFIYSTELIANQLLALLWPWTRWCSVAKQNINVLPTPQLIFWNW